MPAVQAVTVLGSTGSIGTSTLDVLARHPGRYRVFALTANRQTDRLLQQCLQYQPDYAVLADSGAVGAFEQVLRAAGCETRVIGGVEGLEWVAAHPDVHVVMAAIVGFAGLAPTLAAVRAGKKVLLANKEALVCAGQLFMQAVHASGSQLLPIDSEHNAIFQCLPAGESPDAAGVRRLVLTASGGPFRTWPPEAMQDVTPEQACAHPNWSMGRKISVDSATMMNKGLELIEACWLFGVRPDKVSIVLHPQSIVHSMVEYEDGSTLAQLGNPDMRTPIAYGLAWPARMTAGVAPLDLVSAGRLDFEAPDEQRFPALRLARAAFEAGGAAPVILNAANEVAVEAFLQRQLPFLAIARLVEATLERLGSGEGAMATLADVYEADQQGRTVANQLLAAGVGAR